MVFNAYETMANHVENGMKYAASLLVPKRPWIFLAAAGAWYYGRCLAITYAPGAIAGHFIQMTVLFMKSVAVGTAVGTAIVAPIITPQILPFVIDFAGCGAFILVVIIGNLALKYFSKQKAAPERI